MNLSTTELEDRDASESHHPTSDSLGIGPVDAALEQTASAYLECLENGSFVSPEEFIAQRDLPDAGLEGNQRLLESLRSIRLLQLAARGFDARQEHASDSEASFESLSLIGHTLGDYRLLRQIGRGGMGIVFEAEQVSLGRRVAVKVLPPASMLDERHVARFAVESQAAAQLQHPNIVPIYSVGCQDSIYFYSMSLIDTVPLVGPLSAHEVAKLATSVARALNHAHELGVIHRDVKPSNLLLDREQKIWVADFGLARSRATADMTATGAVVGTLRYMSPEQAIGDSHLIDHRTDIYALGVTMYELLVGRCPYDASDRGTFLAELERGEPASLRKQRKEIPVDMETIVLKSMARDRDQRYGTAKELADDLDRFLAGAVISARRPHMIDRLGKWVRRNRRWATIALTTWVCISIGAVITALLLAAASKATSDALAESRSSLAEADAFYDQARQVIDHFAVSVSPRLADIPEAGSIRREVLRDTLHYYQAFVDQVADNPMRQRDLAETQMNVAAIADQLGAPEESIRAYQQAAAVLGKLPNSRAEEALCWNNLGGLWKRCGQPEWADKAYENAAACHEEILEAKPGDSESTRRWALTLAARGNLWAQAGETRRSLPLLNKAREIQETLFRESNGSREFDRALRHDVLVTLGSIASTLRSIDSEAALAASAACLEQARSIRKNAGETVLLRDASVLQDALAAWNNHAALLADADRIAEAIELLKESASFGQEICELHPAEPDHLHELAAVENKLGRLYGVQEDYESQRRAFKRSYRMLQSLVKRFPKAARYRASLASASYNMGVLAEAQRELGEALKELRFCKEEIDWLESHAPEVVDAMRDLVTDCNHRLARLSRS